MMEKDYRRCKNEGNRKKKKTGNYSKPISIIHTPLFSKK